MTLKAETLSEARKNAGDPESGRKGCRGEDSCGLVLSRRCGNSKPLVSHLLVSTGQHREPSSSLFTQSQLAQVPRPDCHLLVSLLRDTMPINTCLPAQGMSTRKSIKGESLFSSP